MSLNERERGEADRGEGKKNSEAKKRARRGHKEMKRGDGSKRDGRREGWGRNER